MLVLQFLLNRLGHKNEQGNEVSSETMVVSPSYADDSIQCSSTGENLSTDEVAVIVTECVEIKSTV